VHQLFLALEQVSAPINRNSRTLSARLSGIGSRISSGGERRYLGRLVEKYGSDVEQMARDRRLNPEQRTSGQLKRALKKAGMDEEVKP
jgi:nucleolar protein 16